MTGIKIQLKVQLLTKTIKREGKKGEIIISEKVWVLIYSWFCYYNYNIHIYKNSSKKLV